MRTLPVGLFEALSVEYYPEAWLSSTAALFHPHTGTQRNKRMGFLFSGVRLTTFFCGGFLYETCSLSLHCVRERQVDTGTTRSVR
jgi:hypothetical protein